MSTITIHSAAGLRTQAPRGARWAAALFARFLEVFTPPPAAPVSLAQQRSDEAEYVRCLARRVAATQPGFAADLYAAAARHEGLED
jgi:hypothetical protein